MWHTIIIIIFILVILFLLYFLKEVIKDKPIIIAVLLVAILIISSIYTKIFDKLWDRIFPPTPIGSSTETTTSVPEDNNHKQNDKDNPSDGKGGSETTISDSSAGSNHWDDSEVSKPEETYLTELQQTEKNEYIQVDTNYNIDNDGKKYTRGSNIYCRSNSGSSGRGVVEYALIGNYKALKGTIYIPYESRNIEFTSAPMFRIYGDDQLVYSAPALEKPIDFAINVEGIRLLKVYIHGGWYKGDGTGLIPCICAGNLILSTESDASIKKDTSLPKRYLTDLSPNDINSLYSSYIDDYLSDIDGNRYYRGDVIANGDSNGFVEYRIDGEYSTLKGIAYIPSVSIGQKYKQDPCVKIYIDDELKKEITLDSKESSIGFTVDISNAEYIKIEGYGGWYKGDGSGLIPGICVGNLCLY